MTVISFGVTRPHCVLGGGPLNGAARMKPAAGIVVTKE
jgi:hypothetical protein